MPVLDAKAEGKFVPDQHWDEHGTCFNVKDRGLVVISSCGHAGIMNTVRQDDRCLRRFEGPRSDWQPFHLFAADDDYVRKTVTELKQLDPDVIIPMPLFGTHLRSGHPRADARSAPITSTTGTEYTFGA